MSRTGNKGQQISAWMPFKKKSKLLVHTLTKTFVEGLDVSSGTCGSRIHAFSKPAEAIYSRQGNGFSSPLPQVQLLPAYFCHLPGLSINKALKFSTTGELANFLGEYYKSILSEMKLNSVLLQKDLFCRPEWASFK